MGKVGLVMTKEKKFCILFMLGVVLVVASAVFLSRPPYSIDRASIGAGILATGLTMAILAGIFFPCSPTVKEEDEKVGDAADETMTDYEGVAVTVGCTMEKPKDALSEEGVAKCTLIMGGVVTLLVVKPGSGRRKLFFNQKELLDSPWVVKLEGAGEEEGLEVVGGGILKIQSPPNPDGSSVSDEEDLDG